MISSIFTEDERSVVPKGAATVFGGTASLVGFGNKEVPFEQSQQVPLELTVHRTSNIEGLGQLERGHKNSEFPLASCLLPTRPIFRE